MRSEMPKPPHSPVAPTPVGKDFVRSDQMATAHALRAGKKPPMPK